MMSLENDFFLLRGHFNICNFRALQLVHSVVLDTSAVFPHYCGLPYRRSLRSLVSSYLKVIMAMLSNSDRRKQLLCFHCSIGPLLKTFICSVRSNPHGATTPMRMLGPVSISCSGRPGDHFSHPFLNQNVLLKQNLFKMSLFENIYWFSFSPTWFSLKIISGKMAVAGRQLWWKPSF